MTKESKKIIKYVFNTLAKLSRHDYFNKELWRKLPNRQNDDKADIQAAFLRKTLIEGSGIQIAPIGLSWAEEVDIKEVEKDLSKYNDIWKDYTEWCITQR